MASITIRNIDEQLKQKLRIQAARHGHSMEQEVRHILRRAVEDDTETMSFADLARSVFGEQGVELEQHPEVEVRRVPGLDS